MTNTQHTPGPWERCSYTKPDGSLITSPKDVADTTAHSALQSNGTTLWGVSAHRGDEAPVICYSGNGPNSEANAPLIAATPELLEALETLREDIRMLQSMEWVPDGTGRAEQASIDLADAAIAKAKGIAA